MSSQFDKQNFENNFRVTHLIFFALAAGQLLMLAVFIFFHKDSLTPINSSLDNIFTFIVPLAGLISMFLSKLLYGRNILKAEQTESIIQKLNKYRTFKIISWAVLESSGLFSLVAFFATANYLYVVVFILVFGFFLFNRPSKEGFVIDMQITGPVKEAILRE
jgi:hypothetical protein